VLADVGGFDTGLRRTEDWEMWLRLARNGRPACVPRPLVGIRQHISNVVVDPRRIQEESAILVGRHGVRVDAVAARRRAAWGLLRSGRRWAAAREYLSLARQGDSKSLARAAVALLHPAVGTQRIFALAGMPNNADWARQARVWLDPLAQECGPAR
jgi:hypothetical protein